MKNIIYILFAIVFAYACDDRKDPYYKLDKAPEIGLKRDIDTGYVALIEDSNKLSVTYRVSIKYHDEEKLKLNISRNFTVDSISVVGQNVFVHNNQEGESVIGFSMIDSYGKNNKAQLKITAFKNLSPICDFNAYLDNSIKSSDTLGIIVDASKSYDRDTKWGGHIIKYEYNINGNVSINSLNKVPFIFFLHGQKRITVRVQDDNGEWSEAITHFIII